jgi:hypothetical protein
MVDHSENGRLAVIQGITAVKSGLPVSGSQRYIDHARTAGVYFRYAPGPGDGVPISRHNARTAGPVPLLADQTGSMSPPDRRRPVSGNRTLLAVSRTVHRPA